MESEVIKEILLKFANYTPADKHCILRHALKHASKDKYECLVKTKLYSIKKVLMLSVFFGLFGLDRLYIGEKELCIIKLMFGWITLGILPIIDIFISYKKARELNLYKLLLVLET